jgi:hypothetical protein
MTLDPVKGMLIAATSATKHRLCPAANLHPAMRANDFVALLCQGFVKHGGHHLLGCFGYLTLHWNLASQYFHIHNYHNLTCSCLQVELLRLQRSFLDSLAFSHSELR